MGSIKRNWLLAGMFAFVLMFGCFFGLGIDNQVQIALAETEITSASTSWSGEMACDEDVTISSSVSVTGNTVLTIALGKTLTLEDGLTINNNRTLTISGPGTLAISKNDAGSDGALNISSSGRLMLNDGRVVVNATGSSDYGINAKNNSEIDVYDGALIVNGGTSAGIKANTIGLYRGLLSVHATGTDDTLTFGILMENLYVGDEDYHVQLPTLEVVDPSTNSYGVANPNPGYSGSFHYYSGFIEITSSTKALNCHSQGWDGQIGYSGANKIDATSGVDGDEPYISVCQADYIIKRLAEFGDYGFTINCGRKEATLLVGSENNIATFEGRTSVDGELTQFDRFIKDMFCPMEHGPYGLVKDIVITGGDATKWEATDTGIVINDAFLEPLTMTGKYTYLNGTSYVEVPFEISFTIATEITSSTSVWSCRMICNNDVTISSSVSLSGSSELFIAPGKTITLPSGLIIGDEKTFTFNGLGTLEISRENTYDEGALTIGYESKFIQNDGCVKVTSTGDSEYAIWADYEDSDITINDGALIVNGGTKAGIQGHNINVVKGLLRVHAIGDDSAETCGIMMDSLICGKEDDYTCYPTIEVVDPSVNSYGITNPDPVMQNSSSTPGVFKYVSGALEVSSSNRAIYVHAVDWDNHIAYCGPNKEESAEGGQGDSPYIFATTTARNILTKGKLGEYGIMVHKDRAQNMTRIGDSTSDTASFEGRTNPSEPMTKLDQIIKDLFCPAEFGLYGILKDITVSGGNSDLMTITTHGIIVHGPFLEPVTMSGKYTYFVGSDYQEKPFEIVFTVATEVTSGTPNFGCKMICADDVTISASVKIPCCTDLYIDAGKTLTLQNGLNLNNSASTLRVYGPGTLDVSKNNGGSNSAALTLDNNATFILNDGYVNLLSTGNTYYGIYAKNNSKLIINDGALIVNGGTKSGIKANEITLNRGLLRVGTAGTDDIATYGIYMNSLTVGIEDDYNHRPTLEVVESSASGSYGIATPEGSGDFYYYCGFVEILANTQAFNCFSINNTDAIIYSGSSKANASTSGANINDLYVLINHDPSNLPKSTDYDYCFTLNVDGKEDSIYLTPTSLTLPFEGRSSENLTLTDLDQFIKDFFYPITNGGPYGTVKDIEITGGNGQVVGTTNGFAVNGKFNGTITVSGSYTYFDGTEYAEVPFAIDIVVSGGPDLTYEAHGDTITATYGTFGTYNITIIAPTENLTYDGNSKVATLEAGYNVYMFPNAMIVYSQGGNTVTDCQNAGTYNATITFDTAVAQVSFEILKANPTYTVPTGLSIEVGSTLADITLPSGWSWVNNAQDVGEVGNNIFKATFTPLDTQNYNVVENVDVVVHVVAQNDHGEEGDAPQNHGFCLGWISFIVAMVALLWLILNLSFKLYKKQVFRILGILLALVGLAFSVGIVVIHCCAVSIVSIIVASIALLGFVLFWSLSREMNK